MYRGLDHTNCLQKLNGSQTQIGVQAGVISQCRVLNLRYERCRCSYKVKFVVIYETKATGRGVRQFRGGGRVTIIGRSQSVISKLDLDPHDPVTCDGYVVHSNKAVEHKASTPSSSWADRVRAIAALAQKTSAVWSKSRVRMAQHTKAEARRRVLSAHQHIILVMLTVVGFGKTGQRLENMRGHDIHEGLAHHVTLRRAALAVGRKAEIHCVLSALEFDDAGTLDINVEQVGVKVWRKDVYV